MTREPNDFQLLCEALPPYLLRRWLQERRVGWTDVIDGPEDLWTVGRYAGGFVIESRGYGESEPMSAADMARDCARAVGREIVNERKV